MAFQKPDVKCLYRISKEAYKAVLSSLKFVCATISDHNIHFKSFSSPCQFCHWWLYFALNVNKYLRPLKIYRWGGFIDFLKAPIKQICLCHKIYSPFALPEAPRHPLACQKFQEFQVGNFSTVFIWPGKTRHKFSSKRAIWNMCHLEYEQSIDSFW